MGNESGIPTSPPRPHRFAALDITPKGCFICGKPPEDPIHVETSKELDWDAILGRPDWDTFEGDSGRPESNGRAVSLRLPGDAGGDRISEVSPRDDGGRGGNSRSEEADHREVPERPESAPEVPTPLPVSEIDKSQYEELKPMRPSEEDQWERDTFGKND